MPSFDSICVREVPDPRTTKPHILPLYLTSSYAFESVDDQIKIFNQQKSGHTYSRYGNPTVEAVADKIAQLECFDSDTKGHGIMFSSGMAALHTLLLSTLKSGDAVLTQGNLYGGSTELLLKIGPRCGIKPILTDLTDLENVEGALKANPAIKLIYFETPTNPTLQCVDIGAITDLAKKYGCLTAVDNTFATPYLQRPFKFGVDLIMHSTTKYLNGHGNSIAGVLVGRDEEFMQNQVWNTMKLIGTNPGPMDVWLVHQGMKTLTLRMDRHCTNAQTIAEYLDDHPKVSIVNYTGLAGHPYHEIAKKQMTGFGGMLSFEVKGGMEPALAVMRKLRFCTMAPTLGDVDTLVLHPVTSSHLNVAPEIREQNGITDGLIRLSVGIEGVGDILSDLSLALD
jgi:methionine-gamma-lyase